ncbi:hypothetical protein QM007_05470 [Rothia sp. SD9660Na]|uniref:hypothetical protein n=1 Tax=Rothia sp. SD9660Na TaxID=3047030 RepID=UPI0024B8AF1D|nr:hypothetical protein [Rothia sp. SD9660Na]WHS51410.1 hypothetical protein QM007_05470 [Rothia sp. SD9660Na]
MATKTAKMKFFLPSESFEFETDINFVRAYEELVLSANSASFLSASKAVQLVFPDKRLTLRLDTPFTSERVGEEGLDERTIGSYFELLKVTVFYNSQIILDEAGNFIEPSEDILKAAKEWSEDTSSEDD